MRVAIAAPFLLVFLFAAVSMPVAADVLERDCKHLIEAIERANAGHAARVELEPGALYLLDRVRLEGRGLPLLRGVLSIDGRGASIRGYPGIEEPLFHVAPGARLELRGLTLAEGAAGALLNHGSVDLLQVNMEDNSVVRAPAVVTNHGRLRIDGSELRHNLIRAGRREAGTVINYGVLEIVASAFHDNAIDRSEHSVVVAGSVLNRGQLSIDGVAAIGNWPIDDPERRGFGEIVDLGTGVTQGDARTRLVRAGSQLSTPAPFPDDLPPLRLGR
ncbi:MAG TPA: hypothetical protein PKZ76_08190 [Xanthomonadaceae bacterium]|nr:hypothetical protein [Xanthomonadaceae bacterium]